jgi:serine/threonine protein phosphatase PrpC
MRLRAGVASDRGLVRLNNEDSYLVRRGLYAVCDGMGGARAGEVASEMACRGLLEIEPDDASAEDLADTVVEIDLAIVRRSLVEEDLVGMGTTLTAALAGEGSLTLAHVGDSRAYRLRSGGLDQLTEDHSWVAEMVRRGELTPAQAAVHPHRSVITRVLGSGGELRPDIVEVPVEEGDRILICSDGLTSMVSDERIAEILGQNDEPPTAARLLVEAALASGGEDNVTVVVIDVLPPSQGPVSEVRDEGGLGEGGEAEASDDDEILLGPTDRGIVAAEISGRTGALVAGVRGRLSGRIPPLRGPSIRRPVAGDRAAAEPSGKTATGSGPAGTLPAGTLGGVGSADAKASTPRAGRWSRRHWIILAVAIVVVLAILIGAFAIYNSSVYYVGTWDGTVALFRGLPVSILGIELSSLVEVGTVTWDSLAPHLQARVGAHDLVSKEEGRLFLRTLGAQQ